MRMKVDFNDVPVLQWLGPREEPPGARIDIAVGAAPQASLFDQCRLADFRTSACGWSEWAFKVGMRPP